MPDSVDTPAPPKNTVDGEAAIHSARVDTSSFMRASSLALLSQDTPEAGAPRGNPGLEQA